jgi:hypothetical protein
MYKIIKSNIIHKIKVKIERNKYMINNHPKEHDDKLFTVIMQHINIKIVHMILAIIEKIDGIANSSVDIRHK